MPIAFVFHRIIPIRINMIYWVNLPSEIIPTINFKYGFKWTKWSHIVLHILYRGTACFQQFIQSMAHSLIPSESLQSPLAWKYFYFMTKCRFSISYNRRKSGHRPTEYIHIGISAHQNIQLTIYLTWLKISSVY